MNKIRKNYSCILILMESLTEIEILFLIYKYAKFFKKLGLNQISALITNWNSTYKIHDNIDPFYIEFQFTSPGKALEEISKELRLDPFILRFFIKHES